MERDAPNRIVLRLFLKIARATLVNYIIFPYMALDVINDIYTYKCNIDNMSIILYTTSISQCSSTFDLEAGHRTRRLDDPMAEASGTGWQNWLQRRGVKCFLVTHSTGSMNYSTNCEFVECIICTCLHHVSKL